GIITNIDNDHLDHYGDLASVEEAFTDFVGRLPFYGVAVVCADDPGVQRVMTKFTKPFLTYGFASSADYSASNVVSRGMASEFDVIHDGQNLGRIEIKVPGRHNVLNALAAAIVALRIGVPF